MHIPYQILHQHNLSITKSRYSKALPPTSFFHIESLTAQTQEFKSQTTGAIHNNPITNMQLSRKLEDHTIQIKKPEKKSGNTLPEYSNRL
jgi:hypothetical protein